MSRAAQGLRAWLLQRFTAIYIAAFLLVTVGGRLAGSAETYSQWRELFRPPWMNVATVIFAMAVLLHAWVGIRDVLIDYVHAVWLRLSLLALTGLVLLASLLWVVRALALVALVGAT
jgi:succinate dehydrogenase / fumarate reductase membrane anchor subunit